MRPAASSKRLASPWPLPLHAAVSTKWRRAAAGFKDVVRITAYVKDLADYPAYARVRSEVFGADWPASASVGVSDLLLGARLEVDAVAVVSAAR